MRDKIYQTLTKRIKILWGIKMTLELHNEKVEQHIRKKTHKPNALRFWVKGGVIPLYVGSVLILCEISPVFPPRITQQVVSEPMVCGLACTV